MHKKNRLKNASTTKRKIGYKTSKNELKIYDL